MNLKKSMGINYKVIKKDEQRKLQFTCKHDDEMFAHWIGGQFINVEIKKTSKILIIEIDSTSKTYRTDYMQCRAVIKKFRKWEKMGIRK